MVRVHARFHGRAGTFAHFGDSITESLAFWAPLKQRRTDAPPEMEHAFRQVEAYLRPECWHDWKGPEFGSNDLNDLRVDEYRDRLRSVVRSCLDRGTVVILSTIPPRHGFTMKSAAFAGVARKVAREFSVPIVDYHAEILKRRPDDWDGASDQFRRFEGHDVPTLLARDGVHPSAPRLYKDNYSEQALRNHGYDLRNYLVLMKYAAVIEVLAAPRQAAGQAALIDTQPRRDSSSGARPSTH